jgi:pimeloyl-ACP methyl ester carboxylesterase
MTSTRADNAHGHAAAISGAVALRPLLSDNPMWEAFGQRALTHAPHGGADFGECMATIQRIGDGDAGDWHREWTATASRVAAIGDEAAAAGHGVSACEAYLRASSYYRVSYLPLFGKPVDRRLQDAFASETVAFHKAAALCNPPIEILEIPFENTTIPAYFVQAGNSGQPRPTMIHTNGYDGNIQEMYFAHAPAAIRRGYNCLLFDGPGQGRVLIEQGIPMRPNWESVVSPVIDYAHTRSEIDPNRIVLAGWSFGGFLAPRAAAFERRIAALIADPGQGDLRDGVVAALPVSDDLKARFPDIDSRLLDPMREWLDSPEADPLLRWRLLQRGPWVHGVDSLFEYLADMLRYEVLDVAQQIACPTLLTTAEGDPTAAGGVALFERLQVPKRRIEFTAAEGAGGHCQALGRSLYHQRAFDWLDETLGRG